jgi:hypothetical protein
MGYYFARAQRQAKKQALGAVWLVALLIMFVSAWSIMIMIGNLHNWHQPIPTIGYGDAVSVVLPPTFVTYVIASVKVMF